MHSAGDLEELLEIWNMSLTGSKTELDRTNRANDMRWMDRTAPYDYGFFLLFVAGWVSNMEAMVGTLGERRGQAREQGGKREGG